MQITLNIERSYPPESHRMNQLGNLFFRGVKDVLNGEAVALEGLHGLCCDLVLGLAGQHQ